MNIKLKNIKLKNHACLCRYTTDIPVNIDPNVVEDTIKGFTNFCMNGLIRYDGNFPHIEDIDFNLETGFVEFAVERRYIKSNIILHAHTRYLVDKHFIYSYHQPAGGVHSPEQEKAVEISHEDYLHFMFDEAT